MPPSIAEQTVLVLAHVRDLGVHVPFLLCIALSKRLLGVNITSERFTFLTESFITVRGSHDQAPLFCDPHQPAIEVNLSITSGEGLLDLEVEFLLSTQCVSPIAIKSLDLLSRRAPKGIEALEIGMGACNERCPFGQPSP